MSACLTLDLFSEPISNDDADLEQRIDAAMKRVVTAPDYESARPHSEEMNRLVKQRSARRIAQMEKARGLSR